MDDRDYISMNKQGVTINHPIQIVSFAHIQQETRDLFTYYFQIENGKIKLHSIDQWVKKGNTGNTFKHQELFHCDYKKTVTNYETGEFEEPKVPDYIWRSARLYYVGYMIEHI